MLIIVRLECVGGYGYDDRSDDFVVTSSMGVGFVLVSIFRFSLFLAFHILCC